MVSYGINEFISLEESFSPLLAKPYVRLLVEDDLNRTLVMAFSLVDDLTGKRREPSSRFQ